MGAVGGGIFALRRPRPYSRRLRGWRCVSHRDPNAINRNAASLIATRRFLIAMWHTASLQTPATDGDLWSLSRRVD